MLVPVLVPVDADGVALRDAGELLRTRTRVDAHGAGRTAAQDPLVLQVVGRLASDATAARALVSTSPTDRRGARPPGWRNARTLSSPDPVVHQLRAIGDHVVNGAPLNHTWATGESPAGEPRP